jgi:hypothetical protein
MRPEGSKRAIPIHSALLVRDITLSTALTVFHPLTRGKELQIHFVPKKGMKAAYFEPNGIYLNLGTKSRRRIALL